MRASTRLRQTLGTYSGKSRGFEPHLDKMQGSTISGHSLLTSDENNYKKNYLAFLIKYGFSEQEDLKEQLNQLLTSQKTQFDPDDPFGQRLPPQHPGRIDIEKRKKSFTKKEKFNGKNFEREKQEFDHFHKSFYLDSVPPFPDRMYHHPPIAKDERINVDADLAKTDDQLQSGLYLPHLSQWLPQWTLKKKIAKTYGPGYINYITMPAMTLPTEEEFDAMLHQFLQEKKWKSTAINNMKFLDQILEKNSPQANAQMLENVVALRDNIKNYHPSENNATYAKQQIGAGSPYVDDTKKDIIPRQLEHWDIDLCYELKTDGDPLIPKNFKDEIFREFVISLDRNGSMAPWQKNYAFSLLPRAFGGPSGELLKEMFSRLQSKEEVVTYKLEKQKTGPYQIQKTKKRQSSAFRKCFVVLFDHNTFILLDVSRNITCTCSNFIVCHLK
ncbi:hypothetical protein RFI_24219 [Reticulomyxa filosa]|uniref:Uncharacterized protein n=1 Tax=Reticulomyxa filosa TaxID=46433 RepID=X6MGY4_RETFI|nr:hypothetical protein RFI_24219 [Reticulomyxa filosa]|eukprot:ETO13159.1 hypothetical protein RFI_24219 [Reticulomyxa filosa]